MVPDPAQPMLDLPGTLATDLADLVAQLAPEAFAVLVAVLLVHFTVHTIRGMGT